MADKSNSLDKPLENPKSDTEWNTRISALITKADTCKSVYFTQLRVLFLILLFSIIGVLFLVVYLSTNSLSHAITGYASLLPSGNETSTNSRASFLLTQATSFGSFVFSGSALVLATFAFLLPSLRPFSEEELSKYYFHILSKDVENRDKPYLKALINMKCKDFGVSLMENYQSSLRLHCDLFTEESLLKNLYAK